MKKLPLPDEAGSVADNTAVMEWNIPVFPELTIVDTLGIESRRVGGNVPENA